MYIVCPHILILCIKHLLCTEAIDFVMMMIAREVDNGDAEDDDDGGDNDDNDGDAIDGDNDDDDGDDDGDDDNDGDNESAVCCLLLSTCHYS